MSHRRCLTTNWLLWLLVFVAAERTAELAIAKKNALRLLSQGAVEYGRDHYKYFVWLHVGFLLSLWIESIDRAYFPHPVQTRFSLILLITFFGAQVARVWCIASLGRFWNTRVIVLPGAHVVKKGPYRLLRHPNYLVVACEIILLSLIFHAYWTCLAFSALNLLLVSYRISVEEQALEKATDYTETMAERWRVLPHRKVR